MRKKATVISILLITCSIFSCNEAKNRLDYRQNVTQIHGKFLPTNQLIGRPYCMVLVDTLLVYSDVYEGKCLSVYDVKNNRFLGRFISTGNGPGEVIAPLAILPFPQKDELYTYQRNATILGIYSVPDFKHRQNITVESFSTTWRPFEMYKMGEYYVGVGILDKGRFGIYNKKGELLQTGGVYPFNGEDMERVRAFMMYQGAFCANPESNYFASGCLFSDYISFYEFKNGQLNVLKEYSSYDAKATYPDRVVIDKNCIISYTGAFGSGNFCYMLFSGKTYIDKNENSGWGNYIIVFDWLGNYVKTLETDREILTFCVDETNNMIYAIALNDDEYGIIKFEI